MLHRLQLKSLSKITHLELLKSIHDMASTSNHAHNLQTVLDLFDDSIKDEEEAYKLAKSCNILHELTIADGERSNIFDSIVLISKAYENDLQEETQASSYYINKTLKRYHSFLSVRTYETSTLVTANFIAEVQKSTNINHIWNLRLGKWVDNLNFANQRVSNLMSTNTGNIDLYSEKSYSDARRNNDARCGLLLNTIESIGSKRDPLFVAINSAIDDSLNN